MTGPKRHGFAALERQNRHFFAGPRKHRDRATGPGERNGKVFEHQFRVARRHDRVDEFDRRRPHRQAGHPPPADRVRRDDAVGARQPELRFGVGPVGSRDDEDVGPQHPRRQRDVDILRVVVDRRNQPARPIDRCGGEHRDVRGAAVDDRMAIGRGPLERLFVHVDHDEADALALEIARDLAADAAVAAQHEMITHARHLPLHAPRLDREAEMPLENVAHERQQRIGQHAEADEDDDHRPDFAARAQRCRLAAPDRRERGDGHVERVEPTPTFDLHVAEGSKQDHHGEQSRRDSDPAWKIGHVLHGWTPLS